MISWLTFVRRALLGQPRTRSYFDAAGTLPRIQSWTGPAASPNAWWDNPALLRGRAESEYRNNPFARRVIDALTVGAWGANAIRPMLTGRGGQLLWERWTGGCDAAGRLDWAGMGALVLRTVAVSGEAFARFVIDENAPGVPLTLQVLGPEFLDTSRNDAQTLGGIRYEGLRPAGYWLLRQNPVTTAAPLPSVFVPARDCLHVFEPLAPGAQRGQSWLAPVLIALRELNEYLEAGLTKAKVAALFAGFVRTPDGANVLAGPDGVPSLEPGAMVRLRSGEEIEFSEPPDAGQQFDPFVRAQLRRIAAGAGVPYEILSGDLSSVTFASGRHGLLEYRRRLEAIQHGLLVPQFCAPVFRRWVEIAGALDLVEPGTEAARWIGPQLEMLDPRAETLATVSRIRAGLMSRAEAVAQTGWRVEDIDAEIAADNARADGMGLVLDSDPRKVTAQGQTQQPVEAAQP